MRLPFIFLLATVTLNSMGIGLIIPVMPDLIQEVSGQPLSNAALIGGLLSTLYAATQFLCAPFLGRLSDAKGRRPVLLGTLAIMAVDYVVMALANTLWMLIVARMIGGFASATQATASAAMADLSEPGKRAQGFGLIGAAFGMGFVLGPVLGGVLGEFGSRAPFWTAAILCSAGALLGVLVFPETHGAENRRAFDWTKISPFRAFGALGRLPGIRRALIIYVLYNISFGVYPAVWSFFGQAQFAWSPAMLGVSLGAFGISFALVQGGLIRVLLEKFGERGTAIFGLTFCALAFLCLGFVTSGTLALILTPLAALGGAYPPAQQAIMSRSLGPEDQGALQGVLTSTVAVSMMIAPFLMTTTFSIFTSPERTQVFPGAPFLVAFALTVIALALFVLPRHRPAVA